jgi:hypothetical protein
MICHVDDDESGEIVRKVKTPKLSTIYSSPYISLFFLKKSKLK